MEKIYSVLFLDKQTKRLLKRFTYPAKKVPNKFFWEKMKLQEMEKLTKRLVMDYEDVIIKDTTAVN